MAVLPKIAIIYLSFHSEPYAGAAASAFKKITYPKDRLELIIVDNPHPEFGSSARFLEETMMPLSGTELPHVTLLLQKKNLGFAGANNAGIRWALENGFDYMYLHNDDGFVAANCFEPLIQVLESDRTIGAAQSLILLYPETELVNSAGNAYHYLGIGYCDNFRVPAGKLTIAPIADSGYLSGAAVMLRADLLKRYGLWDEDFFLYHEDIEYSLRLKAAGYRTVVARDSKFFHQYNFSRNKEKFYFIERNRLGILLMFYKLPTLILILPMVIFWELGMLFFSARNGWLMIKLRVYFYWLKPSSWKRWLEKRRNIQRLRTAGDRKLLASAAGRVIFNEKSINTPLLRYVANSILALYWAVVKQLIFW